MKTAAQKKQQVCRGYKGILPSSVVMRFLTYDWRTGKVSYKKNTEFVSTSKKGKKRKHFFDSHIDRGYYVFTGTKQQKQHDHTIDYYELTEAGEDLFAILDL
jgi:hypothetical protein